MYRNEYPTFENCINFKTPANGKTIEISPKNCNKVSVVKDSNFNASDGEERANLSAVVYL